MLGAVVIGGGGGDGVFVLVDVPVVVANVDVFFINDGIQRQKDLILVKAAGLIFPTTISFFLFMFPCESRGDNIGDAWTSG